MVRVPSGGIGSTRPTAKTVMFSVPVTVTIEWPQGVPFDMDVAKRTAALATNSHHGRDVGPSGSIVWAEVTSEAEEDEIELLEER